MFLYTGPVRAPFCPPFVLWSPMHSHGLLMPSHVPLSWFLRSHILLGSLLGLVIWMFLQASFLPYLCLLSYFQAWWGPSPFSQAPSHIQLEPGSIHCSSQSCLPLTPQAPSLHLEHCVIHFEGWGDRWTNCSVLHLSPTPGFPYLLFGYGVLNYRTSSLKRSTWTSPWRGEIVLVP